MDEPALRTIAMPADANPHGDIFGGWLMAKMDMAGGNVAARRAAGRVATIAVDAMEFHEPVRVGDIVSCYGTITRTGRTSITIDVVAYRRKMEQAQQVRVTSGVFTYVKIDQNGQLEPLPSVEETSS